MSSVVTLKTIGNWSDRIDVPLSNALAASTELLGRSGFKACEKAIAHMAKGASRMTKACAPDEIRDIVDNPDKRYLKDMRRARFGVMRYQRDGSKKFIPIYRTGEFGKVKFVGFDKVAFEDGGKWRTVTRDEWEAVNGDAKKFPSVVNSKKRIIGRKGLAQKSWMWGLKGFHDGTIPDVTSVDAIYGDMLCGLVLTNKLRYISKVIPQGYEQILATKASNAVMAQSAKRLERDFGVEVPRLAASRQKKAARKLAAEFRKAQKVAK